MTCRSWKTVRLGDHCTKIGSGATPRGGESVYQDSGVSFIRSQNVYNGQFTLDGLAHLDDKCADQLKGVTVETGDVLLNITGDSVARSCRVPDEILPARVNQHVAIIRPQPDEFDARFVGYFFISPFMQDTMLSLAGSGGTRKALTKEMIERFDMPQPPRPVQERIADILSAYDDLIENNRRRMALLEDAARQLYREWFVRLRFPGHEHTRITGGVPDGWEKVKVGSLLLKVSRAKKIKKDDYAIEGTIPCVDQGSDFIGGYTDDPDALIEQPLPLIVFGDHTRVLKFVNFPFACGADGTQLIYPNTPKVSPEYLYFALNAIELSNYFYARHFKFLKELEVFIPSEYLVREFTNIAEPCFEQIKVIRTQNQKLHAARDLLLPRLMSGEISV
jgi:type I restriction enzyme S subunit